MQNALQPETKIFTNNGLQLKPNLCYFGVVNDRGTQKTFGILNEDRRRHMYILGKTGMGKTTLLTNMILQDINNGFGVCYVDPHGDSAEYIIDRIPPHRRQDVIYFNPADLENPIGFNMLESKNGEENFLIVSGMMAVFNRIWSGMWSARMEYILNNTLLALLETPGNTLLGVVRMLTDNDFKNSIIDNVKDPMVKNFWIKEFGSFNDKYRTEAIAPVLNKIGQFFNTDLIRNILGQVKSTIDIREIMDTKKILIVNLAKGKLGEDNSALLGSLLVTKIQLAAMGRVDIDEEKRNDFYLYVDEFQNFTTDSFATILSEARKYRLNITLAHQYIAQLTEAGNEKIKNAIFGNVGTLITFRVGAEDAARLEKEFEPVFSTQQLINLNQTQIGLKLSINGTASNPFLANTTPPLFDSLNSKAEVINISRNKYGSLREVVRDQINNWLSGDTTQTQSLSRKRKKKKNNYLNPFQDNSEESDSDSQTQKIISEPTLTKDQSTAPINPQIKKPPFPKLDPQNINSAFDTARLELPLKNSTPSLNLARLNSLKQNSSESSSLNFDDTNFNFDLP
jgi:hypothetical protein